jgi:AcrR family transcriptional regulator
MTRPSSRERILKAAETVIARDGGGNLTLESVAAEAGISKGGLLYHFKTKNELILGLMRAHCDAVIGALEQEKAKLGGAVRNELEAHLTAALRSEAEALNNRQTGVALLAAIASQPEIVQSVACDFDDMEDKLWGKRSGLNPDAAILWLAAEGLKFLQLIGHDPFLPGQRDAVVARLLELARERG